MRLALRLSIAVVVIAGMLGGGIAPAAAQQPAPPTADAKAKAKAAFARAVAAEERKDWRTAVDEYLDAYHHAPHPDVLFNVAVVYEKLGDARQSAAYYRRYLDDAPSAPDRAKVERLIETLRKRPSAVTIESAPAGAMIVVDGERQGRAPVELKLAGGQHQLTAEHGGATARRVITVEYGEPAAVTLVVGGAGTLAVGSNEAGATVRIDGVPVGVTPWRGALPPGRHVVIVEKAGFTTVERVVEVPPDGTAQITAGMVRPLGHAAPAPARQSLGILLGVDGGMPLLDGADPLFNLTFGWRVGGNRADGFTGLAFGGNGLGYALGGRVYVLTGRIRPYLGAGAGLVTNASHARATLGLMVADLGRGRTAWDLHVEGGIVSALDSAGERTGGAIVMAGVIWHLRGPDGATAPPIPGAVAARATDR